MRFLRGPASPGVTSHKIKLGNQEFLLPFMSFETESAFRILITAGMDGDEYTGIEAAYQLINYYLHHTPPISLTILPLVNLPGFMRGVSYNPLDKLYPKHVFPGSEKGKPTEQLMYFLSQTFLSDVSVWIDLHSGSLHESLTPFIWAYKTKSRHIDETTERLLANIHSEKKIYHFSPYQKITSLAKRGTAYVMLEAGERGQKNASDIEQLLSWTMSIVTALAEHEPKKQPFTAFTSVVESLSPQNGLWYPRCSVGDTIQKGAELGIISSVTCDETSVLKAKSDGVIFWQKATPPVQKGDLLIGIATSEKTIRP